MSFTASEDRVLEAYESGDLILQAIVDGRFGEMSDVELDTLYAELHLMDVLAIRVAGGEHLVHWDSAGDYQ